MLRRGSCIDVVEKNASMCVAVGVWLCGPIVKYCGYPRSNSAEYSTVLMAPSLPPIGDPGNSPLRHSRRKVATVPSTIHVVN